MASSGLKRQQPSSFKKIWWQWNDGSLNDSVAWKLNAWRRSLFGERSSAILPYELPETPPRWSLIQETLDRRGCTSYLEIGCAGNACFDKIRCDIKVGVDPVAGGTVRMTSDVFFADNRQKFDCIFIDGLHTYVQVRKDIDNALVASSDNAVILLHDCLPCTIGEQAMPREQLIWTGDVWKAIVERRTHTNVDTAVCTADRGIGVILKRPNTDPLHGVPNRTFSKLTYGEYIRFHMQWMRPKAYEEILRFIDDEQ